MHLTRLALLAALLAPSLGAQRLSFTDLSESGNTFRFGEARPGEPITIELLAAATWDELEFEVRGARVGEPLVFRLPVFPDNVTPGVHEGGPVGWRAVDAVVAEANGAVLVAVFPRRERFTVGFTRPRPEPDAPYYTYPRFQQYFAQIELEPRAQITQLGTSIEGRPLYRILIDEPSNLEKKTVLMGVRQHGNEDGSSYLLEGALDLLLGRNGLAPEPELLSRIRWIIYPLMNPDGAVRQQRGNFNGVDLNRDWDRNGCNAGQQIEIQTFQCDLESLHALYPVAIGGDHHGWGQSAHGGYRYALNQSVSFVSLPEYQEARKDTDVITRNDPSQFGWEENGGTLGMLRAEMFLRLGFLLHTPEYTSSLSTQQEFYEKGQAWVRAMYQTLYAPSFTDSGGTARTAALITEPLFVTVDDLDENLNPGVAESVQVTVRDLTTGDVETLTLTETGVNTGLFRNTAPLTMRVRPAASTGNGRIETLPGSTLIAFYRDDDYAPNAAGARLRVRDALPLGEGIRDR